MCRANATLQSFRFQGAPFPQPNCRVLTQFFSLGINLFGAYGTLDFSLSKFFLRYCEFV